MEVIEAREFIINISVSHVSELGYERNFERNLFLNFFQRNLEIKPSKS